MTDDQRSARARTKCIVLCVFAAVLAGVGALAFLRFEKSGSGSEIKYFESSDADYKVYLKPNDYFKEEYLGKENKLIASLIDRIDMDFKYRLSFPEKAVGFKYRYNINAKLDVVDKDDNSTIFSSTETLFQSEKISNPSGIDIDKNVEIDYEKYNSLISGFVDDFDLSRAMSLLTLFLNIESVEADSKALASLKPGKVVSVEIPLTKNTVGIDIKSDSEAGKEKSIPVSEVGKDTVFLIGAIAFWGVAVLMVVYGLVSMRNSMTPVALYRRKLKNILSTYDSYIQEIDNGYSLKNLPVIQIGKFDDMLEIRDTLRTPILMRQNKDKTAAYFIIMAPQNGVVYAFALRAADIAEKRRGQVE